MFHARPHLETHHRGLNHSAVAGAAYRLGLKLYDRRRKRTFDFRRRLEGDEVVFQTTVAPPGAPDWATDPLELWNRVEQSERRKDAQVARDSICAPIAPYAEDRAKARAMVEKYGDFIEVHVNTSLDVCEERDTKGLYTQARAGTLKEFTGISDPYEVPQSPDLRSDGAQGDPTNLASQVIRELERRLLIV